MYICRVIKQLNKMSRKNFPIWSTSCVNCEIGVVFLFENGEIAKCQKCKSQFKTDYEEHKELLGNPTEYWITEEIIKN